MARQPKDGPAGGAWQWSRTAQTQRALLGAARQVFTERGFSESSIADIVQRAGSSVGSLYHHFGGKSELFIALWQEHQLGQEEAASQAVTGARERGVTDPARLFEAGARAYLQGSWQRRDLALLFSSGDAPPGFEVMRRSRGCEWVSRGDVLPRLTGEPADRVYAAVLASLIGEGGYEVAAAGNRRQAERIIDAVIGYAGRLLAVLPPAPGPAGPASRPQRCDSVAVPAVRPHHMSMCVRRYEDGKTSLETKASSVTHSRQLTEARRGRLQTFTPGVPAVPAFSLAPWLLASARRGTT